MKRKSANFNSNLKEVTTPFEKNGIKKNQSVASTVSKIALIGAIYAVLTIAIPMIGYGIIQFRISEALTIFAVVSPIFASGLTLGCFIANLLGFLLGFNPMPLDILFGTLATLLAAFTTYSLRKITFRNVPVLAWLPPVFFNGLIIAFEFSFIYVDPQAEISVAYFLYNVTTISISEFIVCGILGMPLYYFINKRINLKKYF
ncbi:MAG: QueT transporter family protein [Oscillospiraceae bacterium]